MCEQIRVPLDGPALAERALPCATRLAQTTGATLHLVRAVEPLSGALSSYGHVIVHDRYIDAAVRVATEYLDAVRARLLTDAVRVQTRTPNWERPGCAARGGAQGRHRLGGHVQSPDLGSYHWGRRRHRGTPTLASRAGRGTCGS
jgi:hypothetical protein